MIEKGFDHPEEFEEPESDLPPTKATRRRFLDTARQLKEEGLERFPIGEDTVGKVEFFRSRFIAIGAGLTVESEDGSYFEATHVSETGFCRRPSYGHMSQVDEVRDFDLSAEVTDGTIGHAADLLEGILEQQRATDKQVSERVTSEKDRLFELADNNNALESTSIHERGHFVSHVGAKFLIPDGRMLDMKTRYQGTPIPVRSEISILVGVETGEGEANLVESYKLDDANKKLLYFYGPEERKEEIKLYGRATPRQREELFSLLESLDERNIIPREE